jgi:hypothetical protein
MFQLCSCGGGGGPENPDPVIDPVEQITEADLSAAGVPALPADNAASSLPQQLAPRHPSITANMDLWEFVDDGQGSLTLGPGLPASRVVGWALYRAQADQVDATIPLAMRITGSGFSGYRVFYAVGNYSTGKWEIGGRIIIDVIGAGFSLGNQYASPGGNLYILVAVGHPGSANPPQQPLRIDSVETNWLDPGNVTYGHLEVQDPGTNSVLIHVDPGSNDEAGIRMDYSAAGFDGGFVPVFPAEFEVTGFKGSDEELQALWSNAVPHWINGVHVPEEFPFADVENLIGFYNSNEVNGARHPFSLRMWSEGDWNADWFTVNSLEIELTATYGGIVSGMLFEFVGNTWPGSGAAAVTVSVLNKAEQQLAQMVTDSEGRFSVDLGSLFGNGVSSRAPSAPPGPVDFILQYGTGPDFDRNFCTARIVEGGQATEARLARIDFFASQSGWTGN